MKAIVEKEVYTRDSEKNTKIVIAELGNDAGIIGAAFLGRANG
jgi:glucokinase